MKDNCQRCNKATDEVELTQYGGVCSNCSFNMGGVKVWWIEDVIPIEMYLLEKTDENYCRLRPDKEKWREEDIVNTFNYDIYKFKEIPMLDMMIDIYNRIENNIDDLVDNARLEKL